MNKKRTNLEKMIAMILKRSLYSDLFILLRQKIELAIAELEALVQGVQMAFVSTVLGNLRTLV